MKNQKGKNNIDEFDNESILICDEWNLVINPSVDLENYRYIYNQHARNKVLEFVEGFDLLDVWRENNKEKSKFRGWKRNPRQQATLDFSWSLKMYLTLLNNNKSCQDINPIIQ